jgi:hypothetical protein
MFQRPAAHARDIGSAPNEAAPKRKASVEIRRGTATTLALLGLTLLFLDFILLKQNADLRALSRERLGLLLPPLGQFVPPLTGTDPAGRKIAVNYGKNAPRTVLLVFSPTCSACKVNWPQWHALIGAVGKRPLRLVFANTSSNAVNTDYICQHNIASYTILATLDQAVLAKYNLKFTPETILVSSAGKIENAWIGVLTATKLGQVESAALSDR